MKIFLVAIFCSTSVLGVVQISPTIQEVSVGDNITLTCRVDKPVFDLLTEIPTWLRIQTASDTAEIQEVISRLGDLSEKYSQFPRFEVIVESQQSITIFYLNINGVQLADDGYYTCNLIEDGNIVDMATPSQIEVVVKQPVKEVKILIGNSMFWSTNEDNVYEVPVNEQPSVLCQSMGSNPEPDMTITAGTRDATDLFTFTTEVYYIYTTEGDPFTALRTHMVTASSEDIDVIQDAESIECKSAALTGDVAVRVQIIHFHTTTYDCNAQLASVGDHRVVLRCFVKTYPKLSNFLWRISNTGEIVNLGNTVSEYTARIGEGGNETTVAAELEISEVEEKHFTTTFTLEFNSDEGEHKHDVRLLDKHSSGATTSILSLLLLSCVAYFQFVCFNS